VPQSSEQPELKPISTKKVRGTVACIATITAAAVIWLWWGGTSGLTGRDLVISRFDALRIGLSFGVGGGGALALYMAWRRQQATEVALRQKDRDQADVARAYELQARLAAEAKTHQERVAASTEADATERRITELYSKSVEQLGSDKAPVRLGGLYALERLAQDNPRQQQTIVNVLCAYLRMPYEPPGDDESTDQLDIDARKEHDRQAQERQVRMTAQRILADHLRPGKDLEQPPDTFWPKIRLDLTGSTLMSLDFSQIRCLGANFRGATFVGEARFSLAAFTDHAMFSSTKFAGRAWFHRAILPRGVTFSSAVFTEGVSFTEAIFHVSARFIGVKFAESASFERAMFQGDVEFRSAEFGGKASFGSANFRGDSDFSKARFKGVVSFNKADDLWQPVGDVNQGATFTGEADFSEATFSGPVDSRFVKFLKGVPPELNSGS
jgi:uncharacterized protein YjbI with pentapeptide repeats